ncbi:MAG: hypothetical protein KY391_03265 [Actinobacteria bacterium]|nr:hypothetical protein [Actinomycetota bacterium]
MDNRLILLVGPGSAGTSFLAAVLDALGCPVPQPETRPPGSPRGFGDPQWVTGFHSRLLRKAGVQDVDARPSAWAITAAAAREPGVGPKLERWLQDQFATGDHLVVKDPRLAWFIPAWRRAGETLGAPCFATVVRHPLEVIASREAGYGDEWHPNARVAGWLNVTLYTERALRGTSRAIARYEDLTADALQTVANLGRELNLDVVDRASPPEMRAAISLVDPAQSQRAATWSSLEADPRLSELAEDVHAVLHEAAGGTGLDDDKVTTNLDQLRQQYLDLYAFCESTAQFSIAAGPRGNEALGTPTYDPDKADPKVITAARKVIRRTARTKNKAVRRIRQGRSA